MHKKRSCPLDGVMHIVSVVEVHNAMSQESDSQIVTDITSSQQYELNVDSLPAKCPESSGVACT